MEWTRSDVIGAIGLAVAVVAALAGALVIHDRRIRSALVVILCLLALVGVVSVCQRRPSPQSESPVAPTATDTSTTTSQPPVVAAVNVPVNQELTSNVEKFVLTLTTVELHANNRTRWLLSARNGTSEPQTIRLDYQASYVADGQGNRYSVTRDSVNSVLRNGFDAAILPAVRLDFWIEFSERAAGSTTFTLYLINGHFATVRFAPIEVTLPAAGGSEAPQPVAGTGVKIFKVDQAVGSNIEDFTMLLTTVDELPNGRTRWNLAAFNKTNRDHTLRFNYETTYCVDDDGNRYAVTGDSYNSNLGDGLDRVLQPGVKLRFWIEFEPRQKTGGVFSLHLVNGHFATVRLAPVQANLSNAS
jgi:hypothetical protein